MKKIRIYIADDHAILRDGLKLILSQNQNFEIAGEASDGKTAVEEVEKLKPDICLLDISMPILTGLEAGRLIKKYNRSIKIIILSRHDNEVYVKQALHCGINGYILKDYAGSEIIHAVLEVMSGKIYLSPKLVKNLTTGSLLNNNSRAVKINNEKTILTGRENQVLKLICESKSNDEIAEIFRISVKTVQVHRQNIMKKLNLHKVGDLIKYGIKEGIIEI